MKNNKKKYSAFRPRIKSRHPSHSVLRAKYGKFPLLPFKSVIRLGSSTEVTDTLANGGSRIELNSVAAIKNSSNKLLMKRCFNDKGVKTAQWWELPTLDDVNRVIEDLPYPIIAKKHYGSRGEGNTKIGCKEELMTFLKMINNLDKYIFEKYYNYVREYRLHVSEDGCFYTCRKMLKRDTPDEHKWFRNDANCVWILEENEAFDKPTNWEEIEAECVKALKAVGLDFGAIDLRVQSSTNRNGGVRENPEFIVVEINSAPSFGEVTAAKYLEILPQLLTNKFNNQ